VTDKEQRKLVLAAVKKAGYKVGSTIKDPAAAASSAAALTKLSTSNAVRARRRLVIFIERLIHAMIVIRRNPRQRSGSVTMT
jgi:hypothetical protein